MKNEPEIVKTLREKEHLGKFHSGQNKTKDSQRTNENYSNTKQTKEEMRVKESAIESSINAIAITDLSGNITYVNRSFLQMWGYTDKHEVLGQPAVKFWQMKGQYVEIMDTLLDKGGWVGELVAEKKDRSTFDVQLSSTMVKDDNGEPLCMMASFVDITERKNAERKLMESQRRIEQQNIELKKLDQLKSAFLNMTSHELRTPMSSIKGYVQMLLKGTLGDIGEEQKKGLETVLRNTNRLDHLIQDILDISRLESGTMKFIPEKTDIGTMAEELVETMQSSAAIKEITIVADVEKGIPELTIDRDRIKQAIMNIVNNAIKFSPCKSTINLQVKQDKDHTLFEIQDFGRGIPTDKQEKIFDTFYQVDSGIDRKFGGAGLGLSISRGIVLAHGGDIWVESIEGKGSRFTFSLPVTPVRDLESAFKEIDIFGVARKEDD